MVKSRYILVLVTIIVVFFGLFSCSEKGRIAAGLVNGEELDEGDTVPFILHQNYPNPFNPSTSIRFDVAVPMELTLRVYDMDWVHKETLIDTFHEPGAYSFNYDAQGLASGDYFYVMKGQGYTQTRRMKLYK